MKRSWLTTTLFCCLILSWAAPQAMGQIFADEDPVEEEQPAEEQQPAADDIFGFGGNAQQPSAEDVELAEAEAERLNQEAIAKKEQGDLMGALDLLEESLRSSPNFTSYLERARILAQQEELQDAVASYTFAVQFSGTLENPGDSLPAFLELGQAYLDLERFNDAKSAYGAATRLPKQSRNPEIMFKLGVATTEFALNQPYVTNQARQEQLLEGISYFDKALRIKPDYSEALFERGSAHLLLGEADKALDDFGSAVEIDPENTDAVAQLGFVSLQRGLTEAANRKGQTAKILNDLHRAIEQLTRWLDLVPEDLEVDEDDPDVVLRENVLLQRSAAHIGLGDEQPDKASLHYQQAINDAEAAIVLDREKPDAYFQKGIAQRMLGDLEGAAESLTESIELARLARQSSSEALLRRGIIRFRQNDLELAKADLKRSVQLTRRGLNPRAYFWLGLCYQKQGEVNAAVTEYSRALSIQPQFVNALLNRGMAYMKQGRFTQATKDFNEVLRLDSEHAQARSLRSQAMGMQVAR